MRCPKCESNNPEGHNFCGNCGTKLLNICPDCSFLNPADFRYCGKCGAALSSNTAYLPGEFARFYNYTPKFLADKILSHRGAIEGERKIITVLFADLANSTSISEQLDQETMHNLMDGCIKIILGAVHHYEGIVNQFMGDGVMALFGAPVAHEDHAQRACHAALAIQSAMETFDNKIQRDTGLEFKIRIGINTGPVVLGTIGDDFRMDYTAVGDTANLGARMESNARPGKIMVSGNTFRLVQQFFQFQPLGRIQVKGKRALQEAYELVRPSDIKTRLGASIAKGLTDFVGRNNSFTALLEMFREVKSGSGSVVGLAGDAGIGKSRLLFEMRRQLPKHEHCYLEGRCIQYGNTLSYLPFLDIIRSYLGVSEKDAESEIRKKLEEGLTGLDKSLAGAVAPLQALLSLDVDDPAYAKLEPIERRDRTYAALRHLFVRLSQQKVLVLAIEDLHWMDKSSEQFLEYLVESLPQARILLILLYRPEYSVPWSGKSYFKRIFVNQLGTQSSGNLVKAILKSDHVDPSLMDLILNRASGNPLYIEEFIYSLMENGSIEKIDGAYKLSRDRSQIEIPTTIQGIIAARLDRLEYHLKRTMQVASVIGRNFAYRILHTIMGMQENLRDNLFNLQNMELIYEKNLFPELEYIFRHALIQEVAYDSLLSAKKIDFHRKVGEAMKELFDARGGEYASFIGDHFMRGQVWKSAYEYLDKAGDAAAHMFAHAEARAHYARAIEALDHLDDSLENRRLRVDTIIKQTLASWRADTPEQNLNRLAEAKHFAEAIAHGGDASQQDQLRLARIHFWMGRVHHTRGEMEKAIGLFRQVLPVAQACGDEELLSIPAGALGQTMAVLGHLSESSGMLTKAAAIFERMENWTEWIQAKSFLGTAVASMGRYQEGLQHIEDAFDKAESLNFLSGVSVSHNCFGYAYLFGGELKKSVQSAQTAIEIARQSGDRIYVYVGFGISAWAACRKGDLSSAAQYLAQCRAIAEELGGRVIMGDLFITAAAETALFAGQPDRAIEHARQALGIARQIKGILAEGIARRVWAQALCAKDPGNWDEAQVLLEHSLKILKAGENNNEASRTRLIWGRLCADTGRMEAAHDHWRGAAREFDAAGLAHEAESAKRLLKN